MRYLAHSTVFQTLCGLTVSCLKPGFNNTSYVMYLLSGHCCSCLMVIHRTTYQPGLVCMAASQGIILFCLPPHTTHLAQPLDRTCFSPLKAAWNEECRAYMAANIGKCVNRYNFSKLFSKAWNRAMTPLNVAAGFCATGIYPFNRHAILALDEETAEDGVFATAHAAIAYIPLYSPVPNKKKSFPVLNKTDDILDFDSPSSVTSPSSLDVSLSSAIDFSEEELHRFEVRFENNYNIQTDDRYNRWLLEYHPEAVHSAGSNSNEDVSDEEQESAAQHRSSFSLSEFLQLPDASVHRTA